MGVLKLKKTGNLRQRVSRQQSPQFMSGILALVASALQFPEMPPLHRDLCLRLTRLRHPPGTIARDPKKFSDLIFELLYCTMSAGVNRLVKERPGGFCAMRTPMVQVLDEGDSSVNRARNRVMAHFMKN